MTYLQTKYIQLSNISDAIKLRVEAMSMEYAFSYSEGSSGRWKEVARFDGSVISVPPAG